jgi:hypothetical protein
MYKCVIARRGNPSQNVRSVNPSHEAVSGMKDVQDSRLTGSNVPVKFILGLGQVRPPTSLVYERESSVIHRLTSVSFLGTERIHFPSFICSRHT